jgi:hypothetical protein
MDLADQKARVHFHRRIRKDVREQMPKETYPYPDSKLLAYIGRQDKIADAHGITTERGIFNWVVLELSYGEDFYQKKGINDYFKLLGQPDAETRLSVLIDYLIVKKDNPAVKMDTIFADHGYYREGG